MESKLDIKTLSDLTVFTKYARFQEELGRRETWDELVTRNKEMHLKKFPDIADEIEKAYKYVYDKKVLPSMRSMQFSGKPIEISPNRMYNCGYLPIDDWRAFSEIMFLLLGGTGIGYSVQRHHVEQLPLINKPNPNRKRRYLIGDSIEGWADAIKILMKSYFFGGSSIIFDFDDIRPKGAQLVTSGGKAPGPQPLKECIIKIRGVLDHKQTGDQLTTLEVHDIVCYIADAVLAGGIRRAALISLFSADDDKMLTCKFGDWWERNPQRGRANNSAVLLRHKISKEFFIDLFQKIKASGSGEPGFLFSNDKDWGTNPCLTGDTKIHTDDGIWLLKDIVDAYETGNYYPQVLTVNEKTMEIELDEINFAALTKKSANIIEIELENGEKIKLTPDHKVYTSNRGWVDAAQLTDSDELVSIE